MSTIDYIPQSHTDFYVWQGDFYNRAQEKLSSFKIDANNFKPVTTAQSKYLTAFGRASNPEGSNASDRVERDEREADYKKAIREFVNTNIRFNPNVSDYDKNYLGLNISDGSRTRVEKPKGYPVVSVDFSVQRKHTIHTIDHETKSKAKPAGVNHLELWMKKGGDAPASNAEMTMAGTITNASFEIIFDINESGTKVYYQARYINTRGEAGPFSELVSAVVG